jgi:glyoxylase-like metal-dependent hydrolase (beta-lactamase superfamily II)
LVLTHLHFDHVGGIGRKVGEHWEAPFKKANLHLHKKHFHYSTNSTQRDSGSFHTHNFLPVIDLYEKRNALHFYDGEEGTLFDLSPSENLKFKCSHGHTPWLLHPYTEDFIYLADLIPTSNHISIPWVMGYDISPGVTTQDKESMLSFIKENELVMIFEHDPKYWGSKVELNEKKRLGPSSLRLSHKELAYPIESSQ